MKMVTNIKLHSQCRSDRQSHSKPVSGHET